MLMMMILMMMKMLMLMTIMMMMKMLMIMMIMFCDLQHCVLGHLAWKIYSMFHFPIEISPKVPNFRNLVLILNERQANDIRR